MRLEGWPKLAQGRLPVVAAVRLWSIVALADVAGWGAASYLLGMEATGSHRVAANDGAPRQADVWFLPTTTGVLYDRVETAIVRDKLLASLRASKGTVAVIDLSGSLFSPGSLYELMLPLARQIRAGDIGLRLLIVIAQDEGVIHFVRMLGETYELPLYLSTRPLEVPDAEPVGKLTLTERETIESLQRLGGCVTVANFADKLQLQTTAAGNRLVGLSRRGYLDRAPRSRRDGDAFVDPRRVAYEAMGEWWQRHSGQAIDGLDWVTSR